MGTLFPRPITVFRRSGTRVKGVWQAGVPVEETFQGSVQPAKGSELNSYFEGSRTTGLVKVYSSTPLSVRKEGSDQSGDVVFWQDEYWEVTDEAKLQNSLIPHYKYMAEYREKPKDIP